MRCCVYVLLGGIPSAADSSVEIHANPSDPLGFSCRDNESFRRSCFTKCVVVAGGEEHRVDVLQIVPGQVVGRVGAEPFSHHCDRSLAALVDVGESATLWIRPEDCVNFNTKSCELAFSAMPKLVVS